MPIFVVYSIAVLFACALGAIVGLGGGIFIRPVLDAMGYHDVLNISFFSSSAILAMAVVSTIQKVKDGTKIDVKFTAIIPAAILGGLLGARLSKLLSEKIVKRLFIVVLCGVIALNIANGISIIS